MLNNININRSYWETREYFSKWDLVVIGSGIVGLSTAISFAERNRSGRVLVLEKGLLPEGASVKNAGFACYGSPGELLADLSCMGAETVWNTVRMRWSGMKMLRRRLGDEHIGYEQLGGTELFYDSAAYEEVGEQIPMLNHELREITGYTNFFYRIHRPDFPGTRGTFFTAYEGQIDTGRMMRNLLKLARQKEITVLNGIHVTGLTETGTGVNITTGIGDISAGRTVVATNGFVNNLLDLPEVRPARAQALITNAIPGLKIRGTFHADQGYYYFRNVDDRILLGGARHLDPETETTATGELNQGIQAALDKFLREKILPDTGYSVSQRWTGIMGMGKEKRPVIRFVSPNILAAVRMGGMGIAIGSLVGEEAAKLVSN